MVAFRTAHRYRVNIFAVGNRWNKNDAKQKSQGNRMRWFSFFGLSLNFKWKSDRAKPTFMQTVEWINAKETRKTTIGTENVTKLQHQTDTFSNKNHFHTVEDWIFDEKASLWTANLKQTNDAIQRVDSDCTYYLPYETAERISNKSCVCGKNSILHEWHEIGKWTITIEE